MKYNGNCACVLIYGEKSSGKSFLMNSLIGNNTKQGVQIISIQ